ALVDCDVVSGSDFSTSCVFLLCSIFFFFNAPAPAEISTLSLHDALPISYLSDAHIASMVWPASIEPFCSMVTEIMKGISAASSRDRKSTRLNSSHVSISYAVFCLKKKKQLQNHQRREIDTITI